VAVITNWFGRDHGGAEHGGAVQHQFVPLIWLAMLFRTVADRCLESAMQPRSHPNSTPQLGPRRRLQRNEDLVVVLASHRGRAVRIGSVDLRRDVAAICALFSDPS